MGVIEIGQALVKAVEGGQASELAFVDEYYADDIVSIEGSENEGMPARIEGKAGVRGKSEWFFGNHEVHAMSAEGPYVGLRDDQFVIRFTMDVTPTGGERNTMVEVGLYTVSDGRITEEAFLYLMT